GGKKRGGGRVGWFRSRRRPHRTLAPPALAMLSGRKKGAVYRSSLLSSTAAKNKKIGPADHPRLARADDTGDGSSLRGSGNSDNLARRCRSKLNKVIGLHCSSATPPRKTTARMC